MSLFSKYELKQVILIDPCGILDYFVHINPFIAIEFKTCDENTNINRINCTVRVAIKINGHQCVELILLDQLILADSFHSYRIR